MAQNREADALRGGQGFLELVTWLTPLLFAEIDQSLPVELQRPQRDALERGWKLP